MSNLFDSLDAVRRFAGPDYAVPVFEPEARNLLSRVEPFMPVIFLMSAAVSGIALLMVLYHVLHEPTCGAVVEASRSRR